MSTQKTTVIFPKNILKALRMYMAKNDMGQHEQSKVVVEDFKRVSHIARCPNRQGRHVLY